MTVTRDELEFQISQYLDGTLGEAERSALEARLGSDADARALLDEYRRLDAALKVAPLPAVNWDALSARISSAVADQQDEPARTYRIGFVRTMAGLAVAACVLVAVGLGLRLMPPGRTGSDAGTIAVNQPKAPTEIIVVDAGPAAPAAAPEPLEAIVVGPSNTLQDRPGFAGFHDDIISRPSQVYIARSGHPLHDGAFMP